MRRLNDKHVFRLEGIADSSSETSTSCVLPGRIRCALAPRRNCFGQVKRMPEFPDKSPRHASVQAVDHELRRLSVSQKRVIRGSVMISAARCSIKSDRAPAADDIPIARN
jgi:hypothetical protein